MSNYDDDEDLNKAQIPDSQYISESTLIPESVSQIPESEGASEGGDGLPGGSAYGVKAKPKAKQSFVKKNLPFIVIGLIVAGVGGSAVLKSMGSHPPVEQAQQQPPAQALPAALPEQPVLPPEPLGAVVQPEQVAQPTQAPVAPFQPEVGSSQGSVPPQDVAQGAKDPIATASASASGLPSVESKDSKVQPAVPAKSTELPSAQVGAGVNSGPSKPDQEMAKLLAATQEKLKKAEALLGDAHAKEAICTHSTNDVSSKPVKANTQKESAAKKTQKVKRRVGVAGNSKKSKKEPEIIPSAPGLNVHVIKNGLAWIRNGQGVEIIVSKGDTIEGVGIVSKIDDRSMTVFAGGKKIEQQ